MSLPRQSNSRAENPRYVVTNPGAEPWPAQALYEDLYCARGELENRIKEQQSLFATRVSAETLKANQVRVTLVVFRSDGGLP
ncbi:MAG: transposase [Acidobacteria bacterium]|nr:transposase [Acidobacteriota bacterium]